MSEHTERLTAKAGPQVVAIAAEQSHPGAATYLKIAAVLAVLTAFEVGVYYVHGLGLPMTPLLLALAATKFSLVALFYMHLRFDNALFARLFLLGLVIAASIMAALLALFAYHTVLGM